MHSDVGSTLVGRQILLAGEGHHPPDQLGALLGGMAHLGRRSAARAPPSVEAAFEQVEPAEHRGQQIVEIVRDAAGQLADRVHFLRLDQLAFERALLGDVGQRAGEFGGAAVGVFTSTAWSRKCL